MHKEYVDAAQLQRKLNNWCKLIDCKLKPKNSES